MSESTIQARFLDSSAKHSSFRSGERKLVRKATGYEQQKPKAPLPGIGFAGCAS
jgi:hypothetical protein